MSSPVLLSIFLAAVAAFFYAAASVLVRAGIRESSSIVATFVSLTVNLVALWVIVIAFLDVNVDLWRWRYFIIAGLMAPGLGRLLYFAGIDRLGVNITAPILYANPLFSVAGAMVFLGERLSTIGLLGGLFVIAGGGIVGTERGGETLSFEWYHLLLPVVAAVLYGGSHLFRKIGVDLVGSPLVASAVTISTSWIIVTGYVLASNVNLSTNRRELTYFTLAGLTSSVAIPALYLALQTGLVVVVTPLMNLSPLFILGLSFLFFRGEEVFTRRILVGTVTVVAGITLLSLYGTGPL